MDFIIEFLNITTPDKNNAKMNFMMKYLFDLLANFSFNNLNCYFLYHHTFIMHCKTICKFNITLKILKSATEMNLSAINMIQINLQ